MYHNKSNNYDSINFIKYSLLEILKYGNINLCIKDKSLSYY